jgi:hypothetical protein
LAVYTGNEFTGLGQRSRSLIVGGSGSTATRKQSFLDQVPQIGAYGTSRAAAGTTAFFTDAPIDVSNGATYKPDGTAWAASDFQDDTTILGNGFWHDNGGGGHNSAPNVTSVWGTLDYEPPVGGYAFLLNLTGAVLPFVGTLVDYTQFRKMLVWRRYNHKRQTRWIQHGEVERAWADVKNYRYPSFFNIPAVA